MGTIIFIAGFVLIFFFILNWIQIDMLMLNTLRFYGNLSKEEVESTGKSTQDGQLIFKSNNVGFRGCYFTGKFLTNDDSDEIFSINYILNRSMFTNYLDCIVGFFNNIKVNW